MFVQALLQVDQEVDQLNQIETILEAHQVLHFRLQIIIEKEKEVEVLHLHPHLLLL